MDPLSFDIIGRSGALDTLTARVRPGVVVSILGPGGIGKTTLLRAWAASQHVTWVDLEGVSTVEVALTRICSALALSRHDARTRQDMVTRLRTCPPRGVLALDGLEHLAEQAGSVLTGWLSAAGHMAIATSRVRLAIPEESELPLGPLAPDDAVEFLRKTAERRGVPVPDDPAALRTMVDALDRHPLALELAVPWLRVLSPSALLERLNDRFSLLRQRGNAHPTRHGSMQVVLDASWALLTDNDRTALRQLVWATTATFDAEAAEAILDDGPAALEQVARLVDHSWVQPLAYDGRMQFADTVRAYVKQVTKPDPSALVRHAAWIAKAGVRWNDLIFGPAAGRAYRRMKWELPNALGAADAVHATHPDLAAGCVAATMFVMGQLGYAAEATWYDRALEWASDRGLRVRLLHIRGSTSAWWGHPDRAMRTFDQARPLLRTPRERMDYASHRGDAARDMGNLEQALALHEQALVEAKGSPTLARWVPLALAEVSKTARALGRLDDARAWAEEALALQAEPPSSLARIEALVTLSELTVDASPERARALATEAYDLAVPHGTGRLRALAAIALGRALVALGDPSGGHAAVQREVDRNPSLAPRDLAHLHEWAARLAPPQHPDLVIADDASWVEVAGTRHDLRRRGPARRVLLALAEATGPLTTGALFDAGWPGERVSHEVTTNRVYVTIGKLRALGLGDRIRTTDHGYQLITD